MYFNYELKSASDPNNVKSVEEWDGWGPHAWSWDWGAEGNHHLIDSSHESIKKIPKGTYVLVTKTKPQPITKKFPALKKLTMRVSSAAKLNADIIDDAQLVQLLSGGKLKPVAGKAGKMCSLKGNNMLGNDIMPGIGFAEKKGLKYMYVSMTRFGGDVYGCDNNDPMTTASTASDYQLVEILKTAQPLGDLPAPATKANKAAKESVVASTLTTKKEQKKPEKKPEKKPAAPEKKVDPNIADCIAKVKKQTWEEWGETPYKMLNVEYPDGSKYFVEGIKSKFSSNKKIELTFDPKWKVVSHPANTFSFIIKPKEEVYYVAKYVDPKTPFDWDLYQRGVMDA